MGVQSTLTTAVLVFVGVAYVAPLWSQNYLNVVDRTWATKPISDIQLVPALDADGKPINGIQCPPGYELSTSVMWEGSYKTCDCTGSTNNKDTPLYKGSCSSSQRTDGCKDILEQQPREMDIFNGNLICVERYSEINFYDISRPMIKKNEDKTETKYCQDKYRICGASTEFELCIQENQPCPSTTFAFDAEGKPTISYDKAEFMPLVFLNVSEFGSPCINYKDNRTNPNKVEHEVIKNPFEGEKTCLTSYADVDTDPFFRTVANYPAMSEKKIFQENGIE